MSPHRAGGTGLADPATAGPILTKSPIATHNHDLRQTLSRAICNFQHFFGPLLFSPPSNSPFHIYAITSAIRIIFLVTTHVIQITRLAGFMAAGMFLWFVTSC